MAFLASIKKRTDLRAKGVAKEADDRDPTSIIDTPWIGELDPKRFAELPGGGKWMLFYDHEKICTHWKKCQQLYRNNKLKGISNMKVSTSHPHHSSSVGVIILYCGPPNDEGKVKAIGKNVLIETGYTNPSKKMLYKTDTQTLQKGKGGWSKYYLPIPQSNFDKLKISPSPKLKPKPIDDYKQEQKINDTQLSYTKSYLQSLSKSQVIDIVMKLQKKFEKSSHVPTAPIAPLPGQAPIPGGDIKMPMAPSINSIQKKLAPVAPMASVRNFVNQRAPLPSGVIAPLPGVLPPPLPGSNAAPLPGSNMAPMPAPAPPPIGGGKRKYNVYEEYLKAIKLLGFERITIIKRDNFEMLAASNKRLDGKQQWSDRIKQQSVLNGRQKLVVLNWFRKQILLKENIFNFQSNWSFPPYILNIITLHYLENIDDKEQLTSDWSDNYKPCFYFFQKKWNILLREGDEYMSEYQSLVCLKGKECLIAKQCKTIWIICKVRIMAHSQLKHRYQWMSYKFTSAPQAYNIIHKNVFEAIEDEYM